MSDIVRIANPNLDNKKKKNKSHTGSTASTESNTTTETTETNTTNTDADNAPWYGTVFNGFGTLAKNTGNFVTDAAQNTGKFVTDTAQNTIEFVNNKLGVPKQIIKVGSRVLVKYIKNNKRQDWFPAYIDDVNGLNLDKGVEGKSFDITYLDRVREYKVPKERICLLYPDFTEEEENKCDKVYYNNQQYYNHHFNNATDDKEFDKIEDPKFRSFIIRLKLFKRYSDYFTIGYGFNINRLEDLSEEHKKEMRKVLIKGGKSRKQRKSKKHNKSRKNRKSRKDRK